MTSPAQPSSIPSKTTLAESLETIGQDGSPDIRCYKTGGLYYAVISDIHLGHNKNPAARIVENLLVAFPDNTETASLDIIFIAGDVFDQVLMFNDVDINAIKFWINNLLHLCAKYDIELRVVEGTPLHDRRQSLYFQKENTINKIGASLRYIDALEIEYFERFDIHVLYIPDELAGGPDVTLQSVKDLMRARGIEQVDHAIMHGLFKFQIPGVDIRTAHNEDEYLKLVKHNIFIGHDHTHKSFDRIYVQGSFDRLGHGYESSKGHMRAKHLPDGDWEIRFVENTNAMRFMTLDCTSKSLEDTLEFVRTKIGPLPEDAHVRIRAESNHPIFTNMDTLLRMAPLLGWIKDPVRDKEKALAPLVEADTPYVPIAITRENISSLILERIAGDGASGQIMDAAVDMLEELFPCQKSSTTPTPQMVVH